jgi:hypothetical protein
VALAERFATRTNVTPSAELSTLYPVSLVALSVQARLTRLEETAVASRPVGAAGAARVVADATFE